MGEFVSTKPGKAVTKKVLVLCAVGVVTNAQANLIINGDFSDGLAGWTVTTQRRGSFTAFYLDTVGTSTPFGGLPTSAVGGGAGLYAVSSQAAPGATALTQSFTVAPGATGLRLSFDLFANDRSGLAPLDAGGSTTRSREISTPASTS